MRQPKYSLGHRAVRALGLTSNPLRRRVDRLERTLRLASLLAAAIVVLVSVPVVVGGYHRELDRVTAERARLQQVPATLLTDATPGRAAVGSVSTAPSPGVPASWTLPDGTIRTGSVYSPPVASKGTTIQAWMDADFTPVRPPIDPSELRFRAGASILGCFSLFGLVIFGLYQWGRTRLDRRRDAEWTRDWLLFERQWRNRSH